MTAVAAGDVVSTLDRTADLARRTADLARRTGKRLVSVPVDVSALAERFAKVRAGR